MKYFFTQQDSTIKTVMPAIQHHLQKLKQEQRKCVVGGRI